MRIFLLAQKANETMEQPSIHKEVMAAFHHYQRVKAGQKDLTATQAYNVKKMQGYGGGTEEGAV